MGLEQLWTFVEEMIRVEFTTRVGYLNLISCCFFVRVWAGLRKDDSDTFRSLAAKYKLEDIEKYHINGVKNDNRPENLELWSGRQPKGQRVEDLVEWAKQILLTYPDNVDND